VNAALDGLVYDYTGVDLVAGASVVDNLTVVVDDLSGGTVFLLRTVEFRTSGDPSSVAVEDFNEDGVLDIAVGLRAGGFNNDIRVYTSSFTPQPPPQY